MSDDLLPASLLSTLERELGPCGGPATVLDGGITNRNLHVRLGDEDYVVRLCGKDTELLGIDRHAEVAATRAAHALGIAPELLLFLADQGCLVTRWVSGRPASAAKLRSPEALGRVAMALRAFHAGPALPAVFDPFETGRRHREQTIARGGVIPEGFDEATAVVTRIRAALSGAEHGAVPCHNDLLTANFLLGEDGALSIVDWEYAGMNDRYFDLGNFAVNNDLTAEDEARLLAAYWGDAPDERRRATLSLMRIVSDYREAAWGMVQSVVSELDFDYVGYAATHLQRLLGAAGDARLERWLSAART